MARALVLYYTWYGNTERACKAICEGIKEAGVGVDCRNIKEVKPEDLTPYSLIVFGSPTHADYLPEEVEAFMESLKQINLKGKKGAAFDTRYEDAEIGASTALGTYMKKFGMRIVSSGLAVLLPSGLARGPLKEGELMRCKAFGELVARSVV